MFVRKSMKDKMERQKEIFGTARRGLNYFNNYFGLEYPFSKLDLVFVPDISYDALSTQGCLSFKEKFLSPVSEFDHIALSSTILHEIVHQWFGNLTTMKWWDDLWIIESMAVYMADRAL